MMNNLRNQVNLIGHVGGDVELKAFDTGNHVARFSVATNETYQKDGEKKVETQWHRVVAWGKKAETAARLLKKGSEVALQGKLKHGSYEDKNGDTRYFSEVVIEEFMLIGNREATSA